jgi:hypothetical protein
MMEDSDVKRSGEVSNDADPSGFDAFRRASSAYEDALAAYEAAFGSEDPSRRKAAREALHEALREVSRAENNLGAAGAFADEQAQPNERAGVAPAPSFDDLLNDPFQQLDSLGEVMASIVAYRAALPSASSAAAPVVQRASEYLNGVYVSQQLVSSTVAATA